MTTSSWYYLKMVIRGYASGLTQRFDCTPRYHAHASVSVDRRYLSHVIYPVLVRRSNIQYNAPDIGERQNA